MPCKLSRTILYLRELVIRIHVKLQDDNFNYYNEFKYNNKIYSRLEPGVFLTLEMNKDKGSFAPDKNILITQVNINSVLNAFKTVQESIYEQKIFGKRDNEIFAYEDMVKKYTVKIVLPRSNYAMIIKPSVVYDENEISYEGVRLFLNKIENIINLTIDEFETVIHTLSQIDLFQYSQLLLNYIAIKYPTGLKPEQKKEIKKRDPIDWDSPSSTVVSSNFRKSDNIDMFDGLKADDL